MDIATTILVFAVCGGLLMAFSIGANDAANAMASSVGSKAITARQAVIVRQHFGFSRRGIPGGQRGRHHFPGDH